MVHAVSNLEVIRRSFNAFETADIDAWTADWAEDIVFDVSGYEPWEGDRKRYHGITEILAFFGQMMGTTKVLTIDIEEISEVDHERVIAIYTETRQAPGDAAPHDLEVGIVYRLRDEKMTEVEVYSDHAAARRAAGSEG